MLINLITFIICISNSLIFNVVEAAPVNRTGLRAELDYPSISNEDELVGDLQVAENRKHQSTAKPIRQKSLAPLKENRDRTKDESTEEYLTPDEVHGKAGNFELTVPLPRYNTDSEGRIVHNPWAVTYGDLFRDTRFNIGGEFSVARMKVDSEAPVRYYPTKGPLSTVCIDKSTPYNKPPIMTWLYPVVFYSKIRDQNIMLNLRRNIVTEGRGYECHSSKYPNFVTYIHCALLRHMRLESLIPEYPKHQHVPEQFA